MTREYRISVPESLSVEGPVIVKIIAQTHEIDPSGDGRVFCDILCQFGVEDPVDHVVFIFEMVVKTLSVDTAGITQTGDCDLIEGVTFH